MDYDLSIQFFQLLIRPLQTSKILTTNFDAINSKHTVTDSFHFTEEISKEDPNFFMASLDVDSLFTNIPLEQTVDICIDSLCKDVENSPEIPKDVFHNLFTVATKESFFMFYNKFYGVAIN